MIIERLSRLLALFSSDPGVLARFEAEPDAVLTEAGLGECTVAELSDALPLAVADLPPAQAALILDRCGSAESWAGQTVAQVLCRVAQEPVAAPSWAVTEPAPAAAAPTPAAPTTGHDQVDADPMAEAVPAAEPVVEEPVVEEPVAAGPDEDDPSSADAAPGEEGRSAAADLLDDVADSVVGGEDFFGIDQPPPASADDDPGGLTPEQLDELRAIEDETTEAISDNFD